MESGEASHPPTQIHQNRPQAANPRWQASQYHPVGHGRAGNTSPKLVAGKPVPQVGRQTQESPSQERESQQPWTGTCDLSDKWQSVARNGTIDPNLKGQASNQAGGVVNCSSMKTFGSTQLEFESSRREMKWYDLPWPVQLLPR